MGIGSEGMEWNVFARWRGVLCWGMGGELEMIGSWKLKEAVRVLVGLGREGFGELDDIGSRSNSRPGGRAWLLLRMTVDIDGGRFRVAGEVRDKFRSMYAFICAIPVDVLPPVASRLILVIVSLVETNTLDSSSLEGGLMLCAGTVLRFGGTLFCNPNEKARSGRESSLSYLSGP